MMARRNNRTLIELFERGLITTNELIDALLVEMGLSPTINDSHEIYNRLPEYVQGKIRYRLEEIHYDNRPWRPFMIESRMSEADVERLNDRLNDLRELLLRNMQP